MKVVELLFALCVLLPVFQSSTLTFEDKDLKHLASEILAQDFTTTLDPVESLISFVEASMDHSIFATSDMLTLFCQVGPKFYAHRRKLKDINILAEQTVTVVLKAESFPQNLELLQLIVFASLMRPVGYDKVVTGMFKALNLKEKQIFLDSVVENARLEKFVLPQKMFAENVEQFRSFFSKYFNTLCSKIVAALNSNCSMLPQIDSMGVVIVMDFLGRIDRDSDLEFNICKIFSCLDSGSIPARTRSQFLKLLAVLTRSCGASMLNNFTIFFSNFDLNSLSGSDYENYAIFARVCHNYARNETVSKIIVDHQRQVDAIFKVFEPIKFNLAEQSLENFSSIDKRMRILAKWEKGLDLLNCSEIERIFNGLTVSLLEACHKNYGDLKAVFVRRINFYVLVLITRLHPAPTYQVQIGFSLLEALEALTTISAVEYYEKIALDIVPKVLDLIMNSRFKLELTQRKIKATTAMAHLLAPNMLSEVSQFLIQQPSLPVLSAITILKTLEIAKKLSGLIIMSGIMARFDLLMDGTNVTENNDLFLEIFFFGHLNHLFSSTEIELIMFLGNRFLETRTFSRLRNLLIK